MLTQSQGLFCFSPHPTSEWTGGAQEAGRGHSQDSWPKLAKGIFHTLWHLAQCINWGQLVRRQQLLLWDWLGLGQQVVSNCITHRLLCMLLLLLSYLFLFELLNCLYLIPWVLTSTLPTLSPILPGREACKWLCAAFSLARIKPWQYYRTPLNF